MKYYDKFKSDVFHALEKVVDKYEGVTEDDLEMAVEWFELYYDGGFESVSESKVTKTKSTRRVNNMREDALDDVGTFRITMKDAETKYADVPFKVEGNEGEIDRIIYGDEFGDYFDENEIFTIASQPGKMHQLVKRAYMATNESINLRRAKKLLENNGYEVVKKG